MRLTLGWKIALTAFALHAPYIGAYLGSPRSLSTLDLTMSLVDRGRLDIDPYAGNSGDIARVDGHYYSGMPPGISVLAAPIYAISKPAIALIATPERERRVDDIYLRSGASSWAPSEKRLTVLLLNVAVCLFGFGAIAGAMAVLTHRALGILYPDLDGRRRLVTTWLASFGTLYFVYAPTLEHRVVSTFLCFWAFVTLLGPPPGSGRAAAMLCGLGLGGSVAMSYDAAPIAGCVGLFALSRRDWRPLWPYALAGALACVGGLAAYHASCFGGPLRTSYSHRIVPELSPGLYNRTLGQTVGMATQSWGRVVRRSAKLLFGDRYGVFSYSPLLLLTLPALAKLGRPGPLRGPAAVGFGSLASLLVFHFFTGYSGAPGDFGFRYMIGPLPFLMLLLPTTYRWSYRRVLPAVAAFGLVIIAKGVMYGLPRRPGFWGDYAELFADYGLANYTLANLKDHALPTLSPLEISLVHLSVLAAILGALRVFVWGRRGEDDRPGTRGIVVTSNHE